MSHSAHAQLTPAAQLAAAVDDAHRYRQRALLAAVERRLRRAGPIELARESPGGRNLGVADGALEAAAPYLAQLDPGPASALERDSLLSALGGVAAALGGLAPGGGLLPLDGDHLEAGALALGVGRDGDHEEGRRQGQEAAEGHESILRR